MHPFTTITPVVLVIGFSIVFLFGEFSTAKQAVGAEATSIGTAFEEVQLFPEAAPGVERMERVAAEDAGATVEGEAPTIRETVEREEDDEEAERPPGRPRSTGDDGAAAGTDVRG